MMRVILVAVLFCLTCSGYGGGYDVSEPYESKALNPVKIIGNDSLRPLLIASKGKAAVPIVCPDVPYYRQIAVILKEYLGKSSGAEFVITDKAPAEGRAIFLGPNDLPSVKAVFEKAQSMPAESLVVESVPEGVVIAGKDAECENRLIPKKGLDINDRNQSRGTFFATVDFLERLVGVRFYFPGIGVHVPDLAMNDVVIPPLSYSDTPVFDMRALGYSGGSDMKLINASGKDAAFWNTLLRLGDVKLKMGWHNDARWHLVYGKTHPEYFALRDDGTRAIGDRGKYSAYRCYNSVEGFNAHVAAIDKWYKDGYKSGEGQDLFLAGTREFGPNRKYINWGIADAFRGCYCEKCLALTDKETPGGLYSKFIWRYYMDLAKECKKKWPDKVLMNMTYGQYRAIPDFVYRENPGNIVIFPASYGQTANSAAFLKEPKVFEEATEYLEKLRSVSCEKPYIWEHYPHTPRSNIGFMPYMIPHYYQKFFMKNRELISGSLFNGDRRYSYALDSLMLYMMYKINWNPDFDVDACLDEYCSVMFGPAAREIGDYYKTIIDRWENVKWNDVPDTRKISMINSMPRKIYWTETYTRKIRDGLEQTLQQALGKTEKGTVYYDRVKFLVDGTAPFFEEGRFVDLGKVFKYECHPYTPEKLDGMVGEWHPAGMKSIKLVRNDNGMPDDALEAQIYLSYDEKNLYVAGKVMQQTPFVTKDAGKKVGRDNDIWAYDSLEIFLCSEQPGLADAGLDQKSQYHQIIIDPYGSIFDGYKEAEGNFNSGANLDFVCKTYPFIGNKYPGKSPNTLFFEMAIPFSELKCVPPRSGAKWHANFYWNNMRDGKHISFTWAGRGSHHDTSRFGLIEFMDNK